MTKEDLQIEISKLLQEFESENLEEINDICIDRIMGYVYVKID